MTIDRRGALGLGMIAVAAGCAGRGVNTDAPIPSVATQPSNSLHALAQSKGMRFGSTLSSAPIGRNAGSFNNPNYAAILEAECGILVPENEMKWQSIRPSSQTFNFSDFDAMVGWAQSKSMAMRAHTLLWHKTRWMPAWEQTHNFGANPVQEGERLLKAHISTVLDRYKGKLTSLDVVNETVIDRSGELETTALSKAIGEPTAILDLAFNLAKEHAPGVELVYNDYMSWEPGNDKHRDGVLRLLEGFKARGVPVDTLGVQSHIGAFNLEANGTPKYDGLAWRRFLDEVVGMGYSLVITEMDVRDDKFPTPSLARDQAVASYAKDYIDMMLSYRQLKDVLVWGMVDQFSWLQSFEGPRPDGTEKRPCPYDSNFRPKLLRAAIEAAFTGASPR
jgi:endo-1,4-beta-xylanase